VIKLDQKSSSKPACKYGASCYRKNDDQLKEFSHPVDSNGKIIKLKNKNILIKIIISDKNEEKNYFYLTKVSGIQNDSKYTKSLKGFE